MEKKILGLLLIILMIPHRGFSAPESKQSADTTVKSGKKEKPFIPVPYHRNVIKFNPTPMLLQFVEIRNVTLGYERLISRNMSLSLQAGYLVFPRLIRDTLSSLAIITNRKKNGVNLAFDYRYYPFQRNARPAPDGLYIGGYLSYYGYRFRDDLVLLNPSGDPNGSMTGKLNILNLGIELGYQFIFWKRFSVDLLLFGPSFTYSHGYFGVDGDLSQSEISDLDKELVQKLLERFPMLGVLYSGDKLEFTGSRSSFGVGFRYSIQLGFHF
jgi:hypothetical protein